jgi:hypothetical protein
MMNVLAEGLLSIHGVSDVVRSTKTDTIGRWNILTDEENFHHVLKFIHCNLPLWLERHFQGIYDRSDSFPDVAITARVINDDSSMGKCSYLSTSALSYGSYETSRSYNDNDAMDSKPSSYAAAATPASTSDHTPRVVASAKSSSVSAMSSPVTIPPEVQIRLLEMDAKLQRYQGIEEKLDRLERMLSILMAEPPAIINANRPQAPALLTSYNGDKNLKMVQPPDTRKELFLDNGDGSLFSVGYEETPEAKKIREAEMPELWGTQPTIQSTTAKATQNDDNNTAKGTIAPEPEWRTVQKRGGKRNADTISGTPTKAPPLGPEKMQTGSPYPIYNPYKPDPHSAVRNNRPQTWRKNDANSPLKDQPMREHGIDPPITHPKDSSLPAAEAKQHH